MLRRLRYLRSAVCLALALFLSMPAGAEEQKGFLIKLWEKYNPKKETAETAPKPAAPQKQVPVPKPTVPEKPAPLKKTLEVPIPQKTEPAAVKKIEAAPVPVKKGEAAPASAKVPALPKVEVKPREVLLPQAQLQEKPSPLTLPATAATTEATKEAAAVQSAQMSTAPEGKETTVTESKYNEYGEEIEVVPQEVPPEGEATTKGEKERPKLTKEQMATTIEKRVKVYGQLLFMIPNLKMRKSESGADELYFVTDAGVAVKLRDLEEKDLRDLFNRVNNEATRLNTERLHLQLQQQQQLMRTLQQQQTMQQQQRPPQTPQIYGPPPQPPTPPQPPRVFTPPSPPPEPPRRQ